MIKPNIVVFFSDQQRFDSLGCNGQPLNVTPNLDKLASEGVNFKRAYTVQPVCGPARAVLQTGKYATEVGCFRNGISLPRDEKTVARRMREQGYNVAYVGKWHLASDAGGNNFRTTAVPLEFRGGYDSYWMASDALEFTSHGYGGYVHDYYNNRVEFSGYRTDCLTDYALNYIDAVAKEDDPFFLFLSHLEPHHQNDRDCFEGPHGSREKYADFTAPAELEKGKGDWESEYPDYLGCCNSLDRNLGRVVEKLKDLGIYEDTVIIYTTDHGCHFKTKLEDCTEGGYDDYKRGCYENVIHIPMIIRGGNFKGGLDNDKLVSLLDIPPTIMTLAGADGSNMQGRDLQNAVCADKWDDIVYIQISESFLGRALRTNRYTYCIYDPTKDPQEESCSSKYTERFLFDNEKDPQQKTNLINDPAYSDVRSDLRKLIIEYAQTAGEGIIEVTA